MNSYILLIRFKQWTKNFLCFAGIIFGGLFFDLNMWLLSFKTFSAFCFISSFVYILNDIFDKESDSKHPKKKRRPIANGNISILSASFVAAIFLFIGLIISYSINHTIFYIVFYYIINNILYNLFFKKLIILDVLSISLGFIFRLSAGIYAVYLVPSSWIVLCTFFLALFLGFSKRRAELASVNQMVNFNQRPVLKKYNIKFLDTLINEASFGSIITYALFCIISKDNSNLIITIPIVYFALMHYKNLVFQKQHGEEPESVILNDKVLLISIVLWLFTFIAVMLYDVNLFYVFR